MRLRSLTVENFMRFNGKHSIKFPKGICFLTGDNRDAKKEDRGDSNGSGKTAVLRAICFALFGQTVEGTKGKLLATRGMAKGEQMSVTLELSDNHTITRTFTPKAAGVVYTNPVDGVLKADTPVVNARIEELLGISYRLFCSSLYLSRASTSVQFLYAQPAERAQLLGDLVDDSVFQYAAKLLKAQATVLDSRYSKLDHERNMMSTFIAQAQGTILSVQASIQQAQQIEAGRKANIQEKMDALEVQMAELSLVLLKAPGVTMKELEEKRTDIRARLMKNQESLARNSILSERNVVPGSTCPTCMSVLTQDHLEHVQGLNQERTELRKQLEQEQRLWAREMGLVEDRQQELRMLDMEKARATPQLQGLKHQFAHLKTTLNETSVDLAVLKERLTTANRQLGEHQSARTAAESKLGDVAVELHVVKKLIAIFQSDMRNMLFDRIRGALESATARHVHEIAGSMMSVEFPNTTSTGREKFEINLYDGEQFQELKQWSEGESWRAAFAILLALRETMLAKTKCKPSLLLVDDPLGGLDATGMSNFIRVLRKLNSDKLAETILVAVPRADMLEGDSVIEVIRERGRSRFVCL